MTSPARLHVVVFSYNRGEFLEHCVASIERCCPWARLTVLDDDSDDPRTREVLARIESRHPVRRPGSRGGDGKHGGLYVNMQAAFEMLDPDDLFCFIQDDMQLVRRLDERELAGFERTVRGAGPPRFAHPPFMKGCNRRGDGPRTRYDASIDAYLVDRLHRSAGAFYSDVCLGHAGALHDVDWSFVDREAANERRARDRLAQMAYLRSPFAAWLPNAPAYRGRVRTLAMRIGERRRDCDFHPLAIMDEAARTRFLEREPSVLPWAEDFLVPLGRAPRTPWIYHPIQGAAWLKWLHTAENRARRLAGRR